MNKKDEENKIAYLPICMSIGLSIGVAIGAAIGNIPTAMCLGLCVGSGVGALLFGLQARKDEDNSDNDDKQSEE